MQLEQSLNADTMRIIVQLRRLLQQDHGVEIDLEDPYIMENLMDAAREAKDNKIEQLAYALCDSLTAIHYQFKGQDCKERLDSRYRPPLHEKFVGANPEYVYRGQRLDGMRAASGTPREVETPSRREPRKTVIYRGQKVLV